MILNYIKKSTNYKTLKFTIQLLNRRQKIHGLKVLFLIIVSGFVEVASLALFVPVISLASSPNSITNNIYINFIYNLLGQLKYENFLFLAVCFLFIIFLFKNLLLIFATNYQAKYVFKIAYNISKKQFHRYMQGHYLFLTNKKNSNIVHNINYVPIRFAKGIILSFINLASELVVSVFIICCILIYTPITFIILIFTMLPILLIMYNALKRTIAKVGTKTDELIPLCYHNTEQTILGYLDLKLANKELSSINNFLIKYHNLTKLNVKAYFYNSFPNKIIETAALIGIVVLVIVALFITPNQNLTKQIGIFAIAAYRLIPTMSRTLIALNELKANYYTIKILTPLLTIQNMSVRTTIAENLKFKNSIELKNIEFSYNNYEQILKNINLIIHKGEKIGIIGASGSGKTTLMNVILQFIEQTKGEILVDGIALNKNNQNEWYNSIGYVKQSIMIFDASIRYNIALSNNLNNDAEVWEALKKASLFEFVSNLPDGLDTQLGEYGTRLSGGQRQRIGIARAFYRKPSILFLDEATSSLDSQTEKEITQTISDILHTDMTIIIIAHRTTTLSSCDRIIEINHGIVNKTMTYKELKNYYIET